MKRLLIMMLAFLMLMGTALGDTLEIGSLVENPDGLSVSVDRAYSTDELDGEESITHSWIVVELTATNYSTNDISIKNQLSARMVYGGKYAFDGETDFAVDVFEPLVRLNGRIIFRVPKLVLEAEPEDISVTLKIAGEGHHLLLSYKRARAIDSSMPDYYFNTPEEAIVFFAESVQAADFTEAMGTFDAQAIAENVDFRQYMNIYTSYAITNPFTLPDDYEAYIPLNMMGNLPDQQMKYFIGGLLSPIPLSINRLHVQDGNFQYKLSEENKTLSLEDWTAEMNPDRLSDLQLQRIYRYVPDVDDQYNLFRTRMQRALIFGYQDEKDYVAVYSFEGKDYAQPFTLAKYEEGWKIRYLNSNYLRFAPYEPIIPLEEAELDHEELLLSWDNGKVIQQNLLPEVEYDPEALYGSWYGSDDGETIGIELYEDGTCRVLEGDYEETASWTANGELLTIIFGGNDIEPYRYELHGDTLRLYDTYDEEDNYTFKRQS